MHLAAEQLEKKASKVIEGEALDIIIGNRPLQDVKDDEKKEKVQAFTLKLLKEQYGIEEKDFLSAELEIVPAGEAREADLTEVWCLATDRTTESVHSVLWRQYWRCRISNGQAAVF